MNRFLCRSCAYLLKITNGLFSAFTALHIFVCIVYRAPISRATCKIVSEPYDRMPNLRTLTKHGDEDEGWKDERLEEGWRVGGWSRQVLRHLRGCVARHRLPFRVCCAWLRPMHKADARSPLGIILIFTRFMEQA